MEFYETVLGRRSIRRFRPDPVPEEALTRMLEAARAAPSATNCQPWRLLVVREAAARAAIAEAAYGQRPVRDAPVLLLVFGTILDIGAAILILTPLLVPALTALGVDPTHLGVVIVINLMLGGLTPPIGMLAFIASTISGTPVHAIFRQLLPFLAVLIAALLAVTYVPAISLGLGRLLDAL